MANFRDIPTGLNVPSQIPQDKKLWVEKLSDLTLGQNNNLAYAFYKGLRVYVADERKFFEWMEVTSETEGKHFPQDFTYPTGHIVNGVNYSQKVYNLVEVVEDEFDITILDDYYTKEQVDDLIANFITAEDIPDIPEVPLTGVDNIVDTESIGLYKETVDKVALMKRIKSNNLDISEVDGIITIDRPSVYTEEPIAFYVHEYYMGGDSDGSIDKPYTSLTDAITAFIGTGTKIDPQYKGSTINLLSNLEETSVDVNVNYLNLNGNGFTIDWYQTGSFYLFDTRRLEPLVPKTVGGFLTEYIDIRIKNVTLYSRQGSFLYYKAFKNEKDSFGNILHPWIVFKTDNVTCISEDFFYSSDYNTVDNIVEDTFIGEVKATYNTGSFPTTVPYVHLEGLPKNQFYVKDLEFKNFSIEGCQNTLFYFKNLDFTFDNLNVGYNNLHYQFVNPNTGVFFTPIISKNYFTSIDSQIIIKNLRDLNRYPTYKIPSSFIVYPLPIANAIFDLISNKTGDSVNDANYLDSSFTVYEGIFTDMRTQYVAQMNIDCKLRLSSFRGPTGPYTNTKAFVIVEKSMVITPAYTTIDFSDSTIMGVTKDDNRIQYNATFAVINGTIFSNIPSYVSDVAAKSAGLISGNIYYNSTSNSMKRII